MGHIFVIYLPTLVIFTSFGFPLLCGSDGEFAVNIAYGKPATQSSTYIGIKDYGDTPGYPYVASLAVDGNRNTSFKDDGCSHTDITSNSVWWEVDLLDLYKVFNITIYPRTDAHTDWLSGFAIRGKLSNNSFFNIQTPNNSTNATIIIPVNTSLKFKGIRVELKRERAAFAAICLCEVEVLAEINVAEKKVASQSSVYKDVIYFNASLAVDGNADTDFSKQSCSCTNPGDSTPWWKVDLQALYFVIGIRIYQRMKSNEDRLKGFALFGLHANESYESIQTPDSYHTGEIDIRISPPRMFKEIMVQLNHINITGEGPIITLCEVQVFAGRMCSKPPPFPRRSLHQFIPGKEENWSYNFSITVQCIEGYIMEGPISVVCLNRNQWNGTFGRCLVKRCNKSPPPVAHGALLFQDGIEGDRTYNATVSLNCLEGYKLESSGQLRCADDEQWQGSLGRCLVKRCNRELSPISNGVLTFKGGFEGNGTYNTIVSLICLEGYKPESGGQLRCDDDEQWQGCLGSCIVKRCNKQQSPIPHGVLTFKGGFEGNGTYNTTVSLICLEGYKPESGGQLRCDDDEQWQGSLGSCIVKRCNKQQSPIPHGVLTFKGGFEGNGTYNTTVSLICLEGYKPESGGQLRCDDDEQWQGSLGSCIVKRCNKQQSPIPHGVLTFKGGFEGNGTYNTTVSLICLEGYKPESGGQLRCADDEQWQGSLGSCIVRRCNELTQPDYGIISMKAGIEGNWTYNATITIECNPGYSLNGNRLVECLDEWNGTLGNCSENSKYGEPASIIASVAGGVTATIFAIVLGLIIAFILYKRRARGPNDKMFDTTLNAMTSSSIRKGQKEEVILDKSIYAQPNKTNLPTKRRESYESKHEYMNRNDSSTNYYSFSPPKVTDKHSIRIEDLSSFFLNRMMEPSLYEEEYNVSIFDPDDDTRVMLEIWDPTIENDYINACYIHGFKTFHAYIAAQGPTKGILNDFWRMVWQTKCGKIVMLTNLIEEGKHKCEQYWPDEGSAEFGDLLVRLILVEKFSDFTIRTLELRKVQKIIKGGRKEEEKNKTLQVKQFHFTAWPDRGVPRFASSLVHFRHKIHTTKTRRNSEGPVVVHCSAGIGRTGTFLALDYLVDQAEELGFINVVNCMETLRKQRVSLVQTLEQYIFLHEALVEALTCTTMAMSTSEFQETYRKLLERDNKTGKRKLDYEFEKLPMYVSDPGEDVYENAKDMENHGKNRYSNILPDKNHCPYLNVYVKGRDSYINAVFLPAYKENDIFIVTQTPLENTIVDFWRMVYQLEVCSIVMLNTLSEMKEEERYWTENDETLEILPFRITLESKSSDDICTNYTMLLNYHDERRRVRLSRATYWAENKSVPKSPTAMLKQIDLIQRWQQETCNKPIVVHCMNGAERSGLFCVVAALLERTQIEQDVAVEQIIKQMRSRRPQVIPCVDQFKFCYDAVSAYLDQFDTYSNFTGL